MSCQIIHQIFEPGLGDLVGGITSSQPDDQRDETHAKGRTENEIPDDPAVIKPIKIESSQPFEYNDWNKKPEYGPGEIERQGIAQVVYAQLFNVGLNFCNRPFVVDLFYDG